MSGNNVYKYVAQKSRLAKQLRAGQPQSQGDEVAARRQWRRGFFNLPPQAAQEWERLRVLPANDVLPRILDFDVVAAEGAPDLLDIISGAAGTGDPIRYDQTSREDFPVDIGDDDWPVSLDRL